MTAVDPDRDQQLAPAEHDRDLRGVGAATGTRHSSDRDHPARDVAGRRVAGIAVAGLVSLAGSGIAAVAGLVLNVVVGRLFGAAAAGAFFVVVAVLTIGGTIGRLGADTGLVRALSQALARGATGEVRPLVRTAVVPAVIASALLGGLVVALAGPIADAVDPAGEYGVAGLLVAGAPFLVCAGPLLVLAAGLRGAGDVVGYALAQSVLVPTLRPILVGVGFAAGLGLLGAVFAWNVPLVLGVGVAALLLQRRTAWLLAAAPVVSTAASPRPVRVLRREFWGFSAPRAVTGVLEVLLVWADVLLVAALTSPAEAGVYAALSRFVTTGTLVEQAVRVAVAPRVAALLACGDRAGVARLCGTATAWTVLLSWPLYLGLAAGAWLLLGLLGPEFTTGAPALVLLCAAMLVVLAAGNNQTVLLMGGRSGWQLGNKAVALAVNLGLGWWAIPRWGVLGAAAAWAVAVVIDAGLAAVQVRARVGVRIPVGAVAPAIAVVAATFGVPLAVLVVVAGPPGPGWPGPGLALALGSAALAWAAVVRRLRHRFDPAVLRRR